MDDLISRQAVEEMIKAEMPERGMWEIEGDKEKETVCEVCVDLMQKLSDLPPVTPQPKIGHWIELGYLENDNYDFECSECHHTDTHSKTVKVNYCWNCGAKMVEQQESEE